jgi:uncharacterized metal-binding protein
VSAGCVHQKASLALAGGFLLGSLVFGPGIEYAAGALVGIMVMPDLDVDAGNISNKIIRHKLGRNGLGRWVEKGWDMLWYFYRKSLKHGSELSHFPVISTLFRLAYLFLFLLVIPYSVVELVAPGAWNIWSELHWWLMLIVDHYKIILGLMGSDFIHWGLDILTTEHAKRKKVEIFGMPLASSTCR